MDDSVRAIFSELSDLLTGLNYVVTLEVHRARAVPGATPEELITAALGPDSRIGTITPFTGQEVLAVVEQCLNYTGNEAQRPDRAVFRSGRFNELLALLRHQIERSLVEATTIVEFELWADYPFYWGSWDLTDRSDRYNPWVFAFLFVRPQGAEVFIGAASD